MSEIIKIELGCKYALMSDVHLTMEQSARIKRIWDEFIKSSDTELIILDAGMKLVKLDAGID